MEKRKPTYDIDRLKSAFSQVGNLGSVTTATAFRDAQELGFSRTDMIKIIQSLRSSDFYKSMAAYRNPQQWQDVYHARFRDKAMYIKFTVTPDGEYLLLSFKEK